MNVCLNVKKLTNNAKLPHKSREEDEGFDVFALSTIVIPANNIAKVPTGIATWVTNNSHINHSKYWLQIEGRSGLASKGIFPIGGIIDSGYRGEIVVIMTNMTNKNYIIQQYDKIAQLVIREHISTYVIEVDSIDKTNRGDKGFGSSD